MTSRRRTAAVSAAVLVIATLVAGAVAAVTRSPDEAALARARGAPDQGIERKVDRLLGRMTLEEKLQQLTLLSDGQVTDADARNGVGGVFSLTDPAKIHHLQEVAMTQSRSRCAGSAGSRGSPSPPARASRSRSPSTGATSASTTTPAGSWSSPGASTSTRATAPART